MDFAFEMSSQLGLLLCAFLGLASASTIYSVVISKHSDASCSDTSQTSKVSVPSGVCVSEGKLDSCANTAGTDNVKVQIPCSSTPVDVPQGACVADSGGT